MNPNPKGVPVVKTVRCRPARRKVGYQVVYFDAGGRQVAWAPNGPQKTRGQALRHLSPSALPRGAVGYAVVRLVTVETVVRQKLLEGEGAAGAAERRAR